MSVFYWSIWNNQWWFCYRLIDWVYRLTSRFTLTLKYFILFYFSRLWRALERQEIAIRRLEEETSAFQRSSFLNEQKKSDSLCWDSRYNGTWKYNFPLKYLFFWIGYEVENWQKWELRKSSSSLNSCHVHS